AIDRLIAARTERNLGYAAALAARCREHLARAARALAAVSATAAAHLLARLTAIRATVGLVLEALLLVKGLLTGTEDERTSAIHTS
ncbi:MAG: hypothetical protein WAM84_12450, partial [Candidatus Cybelea sp.]